MSQYPGCAKDDERQRQAQKPQRNQHTRQRHNEGIRDWAQQRNSMKISRHQWQHPNL